MSIIVSNEYHYHGQQIIKTFNFGRNFAEFLIKSI